MHDSTETVLVVDDEERLADLFATWLSDQWEVRTAYDGESALEQIDDSVAIVLLDRRMPGISGDEVLTQIREEGYDCRVVMVTAVDPDFDIIEMGFDDYIVKPVSKDDLIEVVNTVLDRSTYDAELQDYYALLSKKALLESEKSARELETNAQYQELAERVSQHADRADELREDLFTDHAAYVAAFKQLDTSN